MNAEATRVRHIVVGIGINVNQAKFPPDLNEIADFATHDYGAPVVTAGVVRGFAKSLDREYRDLIEKPEARQSVLRRFEHFAVRARLQDADRRKWRLRGREREVWTRADSCECVAAMRCGPCSAER